MNANRTKTLQDAKKAFEETGHGTPKEKVALQTWRDLCVGEEEEQIALSAYLRRETNRERRAREKSSAQKTKKGEKND